MTTVVNGYDVDPALLADHVGTTLHVEIVSPTLAATQFTKLAGAFTPAGVAGAVYTTYKWIMFLCGAVLRVDGTPLLGAMNPAQGTFAVTWMDGVLQILEAIGALAPSYDSFESFVLGCIDKANEQPIYPPAFTLTAADFIVNLNWVPGHFGALALQPWSCGLTFQACTSDPTASLRELFQFVFECAPHYVRSQVTSAHGPFVLMSAAYSQQMQIYAGMPAGAMDVGLVLATFPGFASAVALPRMLFILPKDLAGLMRLFSQRCALANTGAGSAAAAEESLLRQYFDKIMGRLPKTASLLAGASNAAEAYGYSVRIYNALPSKQRSSSVTPLGRVLAAEEALNADKVATEVARTPQVASRVEAMERFLREMESGIDALRRAGGPSSGEGADPLNASIDHGGGEAPSDATAAALGKFAPLRAQIEAALTVKDYSFAWGLVAAGGLLAPQQILFNVSKITSSDSTLKALYNQRSELKLYFGGELKASLDKENPGLITKETSMLLDGFKLNDAAFTKLMQLKLGELDMYAATLLELTDRLGGYCHRPRDNWRLTIVDSDKMHRLAKSGHCLLQAVGFLDSSPTQTSDQLTFQGFVEELITALSRGSMIQEEPERIAHYEQIITCYVETMEHCGARAASLLRANPDKEALGYFIPSVAGCGPLLKMRGLHSFAASNRNRANAGKPASSEMAAAVEQPVSLISRKSLLYGDAKPKGKHPLGAGDERSWAKQPKTGQDDWGVVGSKPNITWDSSDGKIIYAGTGKDAFFKSILVDKLGDKKCLPSMVSYLGAVACRCPDEHGHSHYVGPHVKPGWRLDDALIAARAPPWAEGDLADIDEAAQGEAAVVDGDGALALAVADGGGQGKGKGKGGKGKGRGGRGGKGKGGKGKGGKGKGGKGKGGGGRSFW